MCNNNSSCLSFSLITVKKHTQNETYVVSADFCVAFILLVSHFLSTVVSLLTSDNVLLRERLQNYSNHFECGFEDIFIASIWFTFRPIPMTQTMSRTLWQFPVRHVQTHESELKLLQVFNPNDLRKI